MSTVTTGFLGWGNPGCNTNSSLEVYGPGGRWGDGADTAAPPPMNGRNGQGGDLLADALVRVGQDEGAALIVIAVSRAEQIADPGLVDRITAAALARFT